MTPFELARTVKQWREAGGDVRARAAAPPVRRSGGGHGRAARRVTRPGRRTWPRCAPGGEGGDRRSLCDARRDASRRARGGAQAITFHAPVLGDDALVIDDRGARRVGRGCVMAGAAGPSRSRRDVRRRAGDRGTRRTHPRVRGRQRVERCGTAPRSASGRADADRARGVRRGVAGRSRPRIGTARVRRQARDAWACAARRERSCCSRRTVDRQRGPSDGARPVLAAQSGSSKASWTSGAPSKRSSGALASSRRH